mmetsp:Transcript_13524/g.16382  ORF Transcript_13524/g.16382 Transcript_13524/m.16382 type:complete len:184 (-) Transcript_13524:119-670(-)
MRVYYFSGYDWILLGQPIYGDPGERTLGVGHSITRTSNGEIFLAVGAASNITFQNRDRTFPFAEPLYGFVRVYRFSGTGWEQVGKTIQGSHDFGREVILNAEGNRLAIFTRNKPGYAGSYAGSVAIFEYTESTDSWDKIAEKFGGTQDHISSISFSSDGTTFAMKSALKGYFQAFRIQESRDG